MRRIPEHRTERARKLRGNATDAERLLWRHLSQYRPRFTRQLPIGPYIVDLACRQARLAVEVDGGQHAVNLEADTVRTARLEAEGWRVIRVWNNDVLQNTEGVVQHILSEAAQCLGGTHPRPLP